MRNAAVHHIFGGVCWQVAREFIGRHRSWISIFMATRSRIYRRVYNVRRSFYYIAPEIFTDEIVILFDVVNFALVVEARCIYK